MSVINTNITSLIGQHNLSKSQSALQTSMERLSSGLRINSAKDDAAGQAIANRMTAQITGLAQAQRNANDGISVAQTAEGALNQVNDNLQRIRELSVQAQNGSNSASDLESIQNEITQRLNEINRISDETDFNGTKVLQENTSLKIQVGAKDNEVISIDLKQINKDTLRLGSLDVTNIVSSRDLSDAIESGAEFNVVKAASIQANAYSPEPLTAQGVYATNDGGYAVLASDDNYYELATNPVTGQLTWDSATQAIEADDVDVAGGPLSEVNITSNNLDGQINSGASVTVSGVEISGDLYLRNDVAADPVDTVNVNYNGNVAADETLVAYLDDASGAVQYAVVNAAGNAATAATVDATTGELTLGTPLGGNDEAAALDAFTAGHGIDDGDSVVEQGTVVGNVTYDNYAVLGDDGKYYAATVEVDPAVGGFNAADASTWTLTATVDETAMSEVSSGNIVPGGSVDNIATAVMTISSSADLLNLADEGPSPNTVTAEGLYALESGEGYVVKGDDGQYYAASVADNGDVTWDSSTEAVSAALVKDGGTEDQVTNVVTSVVDNASFADLEDGETLHQLSTGEYVVKGGTEEAPVYHYVELSDPSEDGVVTITKGDEATVDPLSMLDRAMADVDALRSDLGAIQNRMESAITNLSTTETNLSAARSRIEDADYAVEVANMTRAQILQQAGTSVLAQANQIPQIALSLLG